MKDTGRRIRRGESLKGLEREHEIAKERFETIRAELLEPNRLPVQEIQLLKKEYKGYESYLRELEDKLEECGVSIKRATAKPKKL